MKARNPNTGNLETIYVKALDSLPVGSEIDVEDGSDIPVGWEEVENEYDLTITSGNTFKNYEAFKIGKVATISGYITASSVATSRTQIATVPDDLKPKKEYFFPAVFMNSNGGIFGYGIVIIKTDGTLQVISNTANSGNTVCIFNMSYLTN